VGYNLRCAIARCADDAQAARLTAAAVELLPHVSARRFADPFDGVLAGSEYQDVWEACSDDPARFAYASEDEAMGAILYGILDGLPVLSLRFPGVAFAYVDLDCFGGTCLFDGHVVVDGDVVFRLPRAAHSGHVELIGKLGVKIGWHFPPFARGFLRGGDDEAPLRRAIAGVIQGQLRGFTLPALTIHLRGELSPAWQMPIVARDTVILAYADEDLTLSLNAKGGAIDFDGRAHVAPPEAAARIEELLRCFDDLSLGYEVTLSDFDRVPLRRWRK
jgi:hypothetical protein